MARASGQKEYTPLIKGLITEASPLNFPEGATADELNFTVDKGGMLRVRRKGFARTYNSFTVTGGDARLENMVYWRKSGYVVLTYTNDTPETYLRIHAFDENFTIVDTFKIADSRCETQLAELTDYLLVTLSNGEKPVLLKYDSVNDEISAYNVDLYIRDFELVSDGLSPSTRPATLSDNHEYNILNAGWYDSKRDETTSGNPVDLATDIFHSNLGVYPSNADIISVGMTTNASGNYTFDPVLVRDAGLGNSLAPRGHYVYPIDNIDRDSKLVTPSDDGAPDTTLTSLNVTDTSGTPTYDPDDPSSGEDLPFDPYPGGKYGYELP